MERSWDAIVLGAGGAGLFCAARAAARGLRVLALDHTEKLGRKILISGGGRCNFTNTGARPETYYSANEHFARSALARFSPEDFLALVRKHGIPYYEKKLGQQFCVESAEAIVKMLRAELQESGAVLQLGTRIDAVEPLQEGEARFRVLTSRGEFTARSLVVATGGLSIPKIGATDLGYRIARQFGLELTELAPALVNLTMPPDFLARFGGLSGVSVDCELSVRGKCFRENLLFTHTGISGPAVLQASLHWFPGDPLQVNLAPERDLAMQLLERKREGSRRELGAVLAELLPERLVEALQPALELPRGPLAERSDAQLRQAAAQLQRWELHPSGTGGYGKAEVTRGGVSTAALSSKTLEARLVPGLHFIGEVVDVTGWLGGYNFQWAWASAAAAAENL